jgi:hypothetical protein
MTDDIITEPTVNTEPSAPATEPVAAPAATSEATTEPAATSTAPVTTPEPATVVTDKEPVVTPTFPEDWVEKYAKGDAKKVETLSRYGSVEAALDALLEAKTKIREGLKPKAVGADVTPEELAEFRKTFGIPNEPAGYDLELGDGYVLGEDVKPQVDGFLEVAHKVNMTPEQVKEALKYQQKMQAEIDATYFQQQDAIKAEAVSTLKQEWGARFDSNRNLMVQFFESSLGKEASDKFMGAVDADGTPIMNNVQIVRAFHQLARNNSDVITNTTEFSSSGLQSLEQEKNEILKLRAANPKEYYADNYKRERLGQILQAMERMKSVK